MDRASMDRTEDQRTHAYTHTYTRTSERTKDRYCSTRRMRFFTWITSWRSLSRTLALSLSLSRSKIQTIECDTTLSNPFQRTRPPIDLNSWLYSKQIDNGHTRRTRRPQRAPHSRRTLPKSPYSQNVKLLSCPKALSADAEFAAFLIKKIRAPAAL